MDVVNEFVEISREMGTNHKDFLRLLPKSVPEATLEIQGSAQKGAQVRVTGARIGRIDIDMSAESERKIAMLALPITHITFRFYGVDKDSATREYERMAKYFQRGGG